MFYQFNLNVRQLRRANNSASIIKRAKERFRYSESRRKRSKRPNAAIMERVQHPLGLTSKLMLPVARKDVLPTTQKSLVIYEYKCHCDSRYEGRTSQRLQDPIKQHVPQWLRQQLTHPRRSQPHRSCKRKDTKSD